MNLKKYNTLTFLLLAIIVGIGLTACSTQPKLPALSNDAVIVAFGDSLTFGTGSEPAESYPAVLEKMIGRRVVNSGVPGEVTGDGLLRLPEVLEREKPALLLLCHGGNDQLRRLNQQQAANNIREMIRLAQKREVAIVLIAVPAPELLRPCTGKLLRSCLFPSKRRHCQVYLPIILSNRITSIPMPRDTTDWPSPLPPFSIRAAR
jgi:lysophospholipase L1-like esterase